jgi:Lon protease-like protein
MIDLPGVLPLFHVGSTVLMPRAQLPLTLAGGDYPRFGSEIIEGNIIGIIQPNYKTPSIRDGQVFKSGCAGKIIEISSIGGEILINVLGICRFDTVSVTPGLGELDRATVSYDKYTIDLEEECSFEFDKTRLMNALDVYFKNLDISPDWREIEKTRSDVLISALAMACPLHPSEKQLLLETVSMKERSEIITKMIEMNSFDRYNTASTIN